MMFAVDLVDICCACPNRYPNHGAVSGENSRMIPQTHQTRIVVATAAVDVIMRAARYAQELWWEIGGRCCGCADGICDCYFCGPYGSRCVQYFAVVTTRCVHGEVTKHCINQ